LWTFGQLSPLSLLFLSVFLSLSLSLPPRKRDKWATPITQKHTYKEEGVMSSTLKKKTPTTQKHAYKGVMSSTLKKNTHNTKTYKEEEEVMSTNLQQKKTKNTPINTKHTKKKKK